MNRTELKLNNDEAKREGKNKRRGHLDIRELHEGAGKFSSSSFNGKFKVTIIKLYSKRKTGEYGHFPSGETERNLRFVWENLIGWQATSSCR